MPASPMRATTAAAMCAAAVLWSAALEGQPPSTDELLARASKYVATFLDRFSNVVTEEQYAQDMVSNRTAMAAIRGGGRLAQPTTRHRDLKSDFLLVKPSETDGWLPFRDVFEVDGEPVRDRE